MKKKFVIKKYREFDEIIKIRKFKRNQSYTVYYRKSKFDFSRIGILVSKKNGNSVERNKIKRQVREMLGSILNYDEKVDFIIAISRNYKIDNFELNKDLLNKLLLSVKGEFNE